MTRRGNTAFFFVVVVVVDRRSTTYEAHRDILHPVEYVGREMPRSLNIHRRRKEGDASDEDGVASISLSLRGSFTFQAKGVSPPLPSPAVAHSPSCLFHSFLSRSPPFPRPGRTGRPGKVPRTFFHRIPLLSPPPVKLCHI